MMLKFINQNLKQEKHFNKHCLHAFLLMKLKKKNQIIDVHIYILQNYF